MLAGGLHPEKPYFWKRHLNFRRDEIHVYWGDGEKRYGAVPESVSIWYKAGLPLRKTHTPLQNLCKLAEWYVRRHWPSWRERTIRRRIYGFAVLVRIAKRKLSRLREILTTGSTLPLRQLSN